MAGANGDESGLNEIKAQKEIEKLNLEIAKLGRPLYRNPSFLAPIIVACIGIFVAFMTGWVDVHRDRLKLRTDELKRDVQQKEQELSRIESDLTKARESLSKTATALEKTSAENVKLKLRTNELDKEVLEKEQELGRIESDLTKARESLSKTATALERASAENTKLRRDVELQLVDLQYLNSRSGYTSDYRNLVDNTYEYIHRHLPIITAYAGYQSDYSDRSVNFVNKFRELDDKGQADLLLHMFKTIKGVIDPFYIKSTLSCTAEENEVVNSLSLQPERKVDRPLELYDDGRFVVSFKNDGRSMKVFLSHIKTYMEGLSELAKVRSYSPLPLLEHPILADEDEVFVETPFSRFHITNYGRRDFPAVWGLVYRSEDREKTIQEALISEGLAVYWKGYAPAPLDFEGRLLAVQEQARKHKRGLWKEYAEEMEKISEENAK